jgi:hypothetical protein
VFSSKKGFGSKCLLKRLRRENAEAREGATMTEEGYLALTRQLKDVSRPRGVARLPVIGMLDTLVEADIQRISTGS